MARTNLTTWDPDELHVWLEDRLKSEGREELAAVLFGCRVPYEMKCVCCGDQMWVNTGCSKRWCPVCGPKVTAKRYARVAPIAQRMQWPLSVMLSIQNPSGIAGSVATLQAKFKSFRKTKFWKENVKGGFVGYEMTHNGNGCHVHLHALVDCEWLAIGTPKIQRGHTKLERKRLCELAQAELSAVWAAYLDQPKAVVWVRRADRKALAETIKYPFKPADFKKLKCRVSDIIDEIDAGRRVAGFGNCHGSHKEFLGRDEIVERAVPCKRCKVTSSIVPTEVQNRWLSYGPPKKGKIAEAMKWMWTPELGTVPEADWCMWPDGTLHRVEEEGGPLHLPPEWATRKFFPPSDFDGIPY